MFKQILAIVLSKFGMSQLPVNTEGKAFLTDDMKAKLTEDFGDKFVSKFESQLAEALKEGLEIDAQSEDMIALRTQLDKMKRDLDAALSDKKEIAAIKADLEKKVELLSKTDEVDKPEEIPVGNMGAKREFKPNMSYAHNKYVDAYFRGDVGAMYSTDETIDTSELQTEFGKYVAGGKVDIMRSLMGDLTDTKFMTTIVTDKTEWRAAQADIDSVLQQFTPYWTPSGKATFTPITIKNFFLKVNQPIKPADIIDQYLGYMYDENLTPDQMPIVKYIVDELILPKLAEDLQTAMAKGEFVEFEVDKDGTPAEEGHVLAAMDGYVTQLKKLKAKEGNKVTWLLDGVELTRENILEKVESIVTSIAPKYRNKRLPIYCDPDLVRLYNLAYRDKFPTTKNQDADENRLDFTNFYFQPMEGMIGTGAFVLTPKENFKHTMSKNHNEVKIYLQVQNYDVKVFIEFRKGCGFAIQEALFAYLPPAEEDPEDPEGGEGGGV